jgi:hypothetical protein
VRSRGISDGDDDLGIIFLNIRCFFCFNGGNDGQISPNSDVILSIID